MSRFSNQLRATMEKRGLTQLAVCDKSGTTQGTFSRYIHGDIRPPRAGLEKLFRAFPDRSDRVDLLLAYLADIVPANARDLVRIEAAGGKPGKRKAKGGLPNELRKAFDFLEASALERPRTASAIVALYRVLKG